jgi:hypothetical protein
LSRLLGEPPSDLERRLDRLQEFFASQTEGEIVMKLTDITVKAHGTSG